MAKILMFSIATNGYDFGYQHCIASHKAYASRFNMHYQVVTKPRFSPLGGEVAWLKITLIQEALLAGYDWVFFVDADTQIMSRAPNILNQQDFGYDFYLANGYSNRLNSGVILVRNSDISKDLIAQIINNCTLKLPSKDEVGWGENGHVIHFLSHHSHLKVLGQRWNNNSDATLIDFIRHYSAGPMRAHYQQGTFNWYKMYGCQLVMRCLRKYQSLGGNYPNTHLQESLQRLTTQCIKHYPIFSILP